MVGYFIDVSKRQRRCSKNYISAFFLIYISVVFYYISVVF